MDSPGLRPCKGCTSLYCGSYRCRFEEGPKTQAEMMQSLDFDCYRANREQGVPAATLAGPLLFGMALGGAFEVLYQRLINIYAETMIRRDKAQGYPRQLDAREYDMNLRGRDQR